jgi:hypothetical protein
MPPAIKSKDELVRAIESNVVVKKKANHTFTFNGVEFTLKCYASTPYPYLFCNGKRIASSKANFAAAISKVLDEAPKQTEDKECTCARCGKVFKSSAGVNMHVKASQRKGSCQPIVEDAHPEPAGGKADEAAPMPAEGQQPAVEDGKTGVAAAVESYDRLACLETAIQERDATELANDWFNEEYAQRTDAYREANDRAMSGLEVATLMSELQQEYEAKKNAFESDERRQMLERVRDELVAKRAALAAVEAEVDSLALSPQKRQRV